MDCRLSTHGDARVAKVKLEKKTSIAKLLAPDLQYPVVKKMNQDLLLSSSGAAKFSGVGGLSLDTQQGGFFHFFFLFVCITFVLL